MPKRISPNSLHIYRYHLLLMMIWDLVDQLFDIDFGAKIYSWNRIHLLDDIMHIFRA